MHFESDRLTWTKPDGTVEEDIMVTTEAQGSFILEFAGNHKKEYYMYATIANMKYTIGFGMVTYEAELYPDHFDPKTLKEEHTVSYVMLKCN